MGVRENKVETYFKDKVKSELGGLSRKWTCPGIDGVPDQIPVYPVNEGLVFVEIKTVDGVKSSAQIREQDRLRDAGALVFTVYGDSGVDRFISHAKILDLKMLSFTGELDLK